MNNSLFEVPLILIRKKLTGSAQNTCCCLFFFSEAGSPATSLIRIELGKNV
jgi:hypothetical protein